MVHVDIALPDYRIAFFLESGEGGGGIVLDAEGTRLGGYAANETPGSRRAKERTLGRCGWDVLPLTWEEGASLGDAEKRRRLVAALQRASETQLLRGRVSAALHSALSTAEESQLAGSRYTYASTGQHRGRGGAR